MSCNRRGLMIGLILKKCPGTLRSKPDGEVGDDGVMGGHCYRNYNEIVRTLVYNEKGRGGADQRSTSVSRLGQVTKDRVLTTHSDGRGRADLTKQSADPANVHGLCAGLEYARLVSHPRSMICRLN